MEMVGSLRRSSMSLQKAALVWSVTVSQSSPSVLEEEHGLGFWDALIIVTARRGGAVRLLSENLNPGQVIEGIRIENPLSR